MKFTLIIVIFYLGHSLVPAARLNTAQLVLNVTKCSGRTKSRCEHAQRIEWKPGLAFCPLMGMRNSWTSVITAFDPPLSCVNQKGKFAVRNLTLNGDAMQQISFTQGDSYWVSQWEFFDENLSPWSCFHSETDFPKVRD